MRKIEGIVVHRTENIVDYCSYHRIIHRDGRVELMRHDAEVAYHACWFNPHTLAVALVGDFAQAEPGRNWTPTTEQLYSLGALCLAWTTAYPGVWLSGHSELGPRGTAYPAKLSFAPDHSCPGTRLSMDDLRRGTGLPPRPETPSSVKAA